MPPQTLSPSSPILLLNSLADLRSYRASLPRSAATTALVPTMGALHEGHLSLIRLAAQTYPHVIVSIFVNPAQFAMHEDLASYPVTSSHDTAALVALDTELAHSTSSSAAGRISALFAPSVADIYPSGIIPGRLAPGGNHTSGIDSGSFVTVAPLGQLLEGAARPTFFRGVATVVMKLLWAVQPAALYLGQKDVQQTRVLRRMVRDFLIPTDVVVGPTVRDPVDGLALSSRNVYLGSRRRAVAPRLMHDALLAGERAYAAACCCRSPKSKVPRDTVLGAVQAVLDCEQQRQSLLAPAERVRWEVSYFALSDPESMEELDEVDPACGAVLSGAVKMLEVEHVAEGEDVGFEGGPPVRLLDNIILSPAQ